MELWVKRDIYNIEFIKFISKVKHLLNESKRFTVTTNENIINLTYFDLHTVKLDFDIGQITLIYNQNKKVIIALNNSLEFLGNNFADYIDHFVLMIISGFYFDIQVETFDSFIISPKSIRLYKLIDDKKNYNVEFQLLLNNKNHSVCGIDNCLREINLYK